MSKPMPHIIAILFFFLFTHSLWAVDSTHIKKNSINAVKMGFVLSKAQRTKKCPPNCEVRDRSFRQCPPGYKPEVVIVPKQNALNGVCALERFVITTPSIIENNLGGYILRFRELYADMVKGSKQCPVGSVTFDYTIFCV